MFMAKCKICGGEHAKAYYQSIRVCKSCFERIKYGSIPKRVLQGLGINNEKDVHKVLEWLEK